MSHALVERDMGWRMYTLGPSVTSTQLARLYLNESDRAQIGVV